ncbi:MAG: hypothetical protein P8129_17520, partial [Anaerolineae bacterium]
LAEGAREADSFDASKVSSAIHNIRGLQTPMGSISYDAQGDLQNQQIYIFQVQEGDWVQVYP